MGYRSQISNGEFSIESQENVQADKNKIVLSRDIQGLGARPKEAGYKKTPQLDTLNKNEAQGKKDKTIMDRDLLDCG